ncbi:MAG: ATP-binding protein [Anaerolineae bacterium]
MQNDDLARWLSDHATPLTETESEGGDPFYAALLEGVLNLAQTGITGLLESVLDSAAMQAVAVDRSLPDLLAIPNRLRCDIWARIEEEVDPEPALRLILAAGSIFDYATARLIERYLSALAVTRQAEAAELARLHNEAERKVMERTVELARANRELIHLEKAKTDFIHIAAHELKTPLTSVQGYIKMLGDPAFPAGQQEAILAGLNQAALRLRRIIEEMLDVSAIEANILSLSLERVSLARLLDLIVRQSRYSAAGRRHQFRLEGLAELPPIAADQARLHQALTNVVNNAIKFTPDDGRIVVSGQLLDEAPNGKALVKLTIRDSGIGIAPEDQELIFEKFYRAGNVNLHSTGKFKYLGAGPGLGLPIARGLIEAHGGRIWAESPGYDETNLPGCAFHIVLPVEPAPGEGVSISWIAGAGNRDKASDIE